MSAEAPTNGPLGLTLTEEALDRLFLPGTRQEVADVFAAFGRGSPRLESVLGVALQDDAHGLSGLELLDELAAGEPNRLHRFFGRHILAGGCHVTANFDLSVERTLPDPRRAAEAVVHFHGRLDDPPSVRAGGSVALLQHGLSEAMSLRLADRLDVADLVVFLGYSGSDYFDVDPFFAKWTKSGAARGKTFLWVEHDNTPTDPPASTHGAACSKPQLRAFDAAGGAAVEVRTRTDEVLRALALAWAIDPPEPAAPWRGYVRGTAPLGSFPTRAAATTLLWDHLGSSKRVLRCLPLAALPARRSAAVAAEAAWGNGRYSEARRLYRRLHRGPDVHDRVARWERLGATLWVQGRWTPALVVLVAALLVAQRHGIDPGQTPETLMRTLGHMKRSPDTRWLPLSRLEVWATSKIPEADVAAQGVALAARFGDIKGRLSGDEEARVDEALEVFTQYDSLHSLLNFLQGKIRRSAEAGVVDGAAVRRQLMLATVLGRPESVHTLVLLPALAGRFTWSERLSSAFALQIGMYHRFRRLAASILTR